MHFTAVALAALAGFAPLIEAHYTFTQLMVNGAVVGKDWQYIRQHTRGYMPTKGSEILETDFRCNKGASSGANTEVYTVKPGDKIGMKQGFGANGIEHPGPAQVYLSKAPSSVKSYDGSGPWFKVQQDILCKSGNPQALKTDAWCIWKKNNIEFTVPDNIPDGEYLVRSEHIGIHGAHDGQAEFYYSCAQIKVEGGKGTSTPEGVKIPGVYQVKDKAINFSVWGSATTYPDLPGPAVVAGGRTTGSIDGKTAGTTLVSGGSTSSSTGGQTSGSTAGQTFGSTDGQTFGSSTGSTGGQTFGYNVAKSAFQGGSPACRAAAEVNA
ncbi:hypothetical protein QM012_008764 [Aureobasidium pullulans]|uniref:AA9 family lytic polysaccharide monooxygenase n=1 Tax=Aureobasidium pullulans TaxID=5580 RepID=A0ABR0THL4_AURPU